MKPLTAALIAGGVAFVLIASRRSSAPASPGAVARVGEAVTGFLEESWNMIRHGAPTYTEAPIPPEMGAPAARSADIGFWDLIAPPSWGRNATTIGEIY